MEVIKGGTGGESPSGEKTSSSSASADEVSGRRKRQERLETFENFMEAQNEIAPSNSITKAVAGGTEDDEAGLLPSYLKRGVLTEDAIYDLLTDNDELLEIISMDQFEKLW